MFPVTADFLTAVRNSHTVAERLDICAVDGTVIDTIFASGGNVTADGSRSSRRDCSFTVPDYTGTLTPAALSDLLSPLTGNELRPYRGVKYADGTEELVPLGVFPVRSAPTALDQSGVPIITLSGIDRSSTVRRNRWTYPFILSSGMTLEDALAAVLIDRAPNFTFDFPITSFTLAQDYQFGLDSNNDPWADAQYLAISAGYELFYDVYGVARIEQPSAANATTSDISYIEDSQNVVITPSKVWDADRAFNGIVVIGESSTSAPVRSELWDDDPSSPTYYLGPYGMYPDFFVSSFIATQDQADTVAAALRAKQMGVPQTVAWDQITNPALDINDTVEFQSARLRVSNSIYVVIDGLTIPWAAADSMRAITRSVQVTS